MVVAVDKEPGAHERRAYTASQARRYLASGGARRLTELATGEHEYRERRAAERAAAEAAETAAQERFAVIVRLAAQAGFEVGRDKDQVVLSFDDAERLFSSLIEEEV